ncbi:hypothetical protein G5S_0270 [Chlamydia pecorum E58]|uniref:Uncharacterized protein n=1 Tax=Chlamydia pecorum (strain ATCC VR-628 / DSM 29919 / E58) TaxID=331635 RepID=A0AA34WHU3_CHLPE|nr:hypothetical protein G5S_0270 [Chlamydia pecorum E58]
MGTLCITTTLISLFGEIPHLYIMQTLRFPQRITINN